MSATLRQQAITQLLCAAVLWSSGGLLIKLVEWNSLAICGTRSAIAALLLIALERRIHVRWSVSLWGAALGYAASVLCFVAGTKLTSAGNVIALQYAAPVLVALFGPWMLGERTTRADWVMVGTVFVGIFLMFFDQLSFEGRLGDLCGLGAGLSFSVFVLFMRRQYREEPTQAVILGNIIALCVALPFMFEGHPSLGGWGVLVLLGLFQLGLPYALYSRAIRNVSALESSIIPVLEPILNPLWVYIFLGEVPGLMAAIGCAVILVAVAGKAFLSHDMVGTSG